LQRHGLPPLLGPQPVGRDLVRRLEKPEQVNDGGYAGRGEQEE
jgi:hypothetical protein